MSFTKLFYINTISYFLNLECIGKIKILIHDNDIYV